MVVWLPVSLTLIYIYSIQEVIQAFMAPLGNDNDPCLDSYMYKRETTKPVTNYAKTRGLEHHPDFYVRLFQTTA